MINLELSYGLPVLIYVRKKPGTHEKMFNKIN